MPIPLGRHVRFTDKTDSSSCLVRKAANIRVWAQILKQEIAQLYAYFIPSSIELLQRYTESVRVLQSALVAIDINSVYGILLWKCTAYRHINQ